MARGRATATRRWIGRAAWGVVGVGALSFAVFGGEFSILDMRRRRAEAAELRVRLDAARRGLDSLVRVRDSVRTHPAVIERIARERYGLVRSDREFIYWTPADSTREDGPRR